MSLESLLDHYENAAKKDPESAKVYALLCIADAIYSQSRAIQNIGLIGYKPDTREPSPLEYIGIQLKSISESIESIKVD